MPRPPRPSSYTVGDRSWLIPSRSHDAPRLPAPRGHRPVPGAAAPDPAARPSAHPRAPDPLRRGRGRAADGLDQRARPRPLPHGLEPLRPLRPARLDRLVYRRRLFLEYWAHAACLVPVSMLPWWKRAMLDYRRRHTGWSTWLRRNTKLLALVTETIRANGPMGHGEMEARGPRRGSRGWWNWRPVQHAIHYLWMTGVLTVHSRRHFQKRYDLLERAVAANPAAEAVSSEQFLRWHVERSLHAMGAATELDLSRYLTYPRLPPAARRAALRAMVAEGVVTEIAVEGLRCTLARPGPRPARAPPRGPAADGLGRHHPARALRLAALAPRPGVATLRVRLPDRGLHPGPEARARLLHPAHPPPRPSHRPARRQGPSRGALAGGPARALRAVARPGRSARRRLGAGGSRPGGDGAGRRRWPRWPSSSAPTGSRSAA